MSIRKTNIQKIQSLIAYGNTGTALDELILQFKDEKNGHLEAAISLRARFAQNEKLKRLGVISRAEFSVEQNQINIGALELASETKAVEEYKESIPEEKLVTRILFITASPKSKDVLRLDKEIRNIEDELRGSQYRNRFKILRKDAARVNELLNGLLEFDPHIIHFAGHGTDQGIVLMDDNDQAKIVPNVALAELFVQFKESIACVVLNSCYSKMQAALIANHINNVIGMTSGVPDDTAITFSKNFYKALGSGKNIEFSYRLAKISISLNGLTGNEVPVLLKKDTP